MNTTRRIEHFGGVVEVDEATSIDNVLGLRYGSGVNEFWIFRESEFPHLAILVNQDRACVHYFPEEGHPGFRSRGEVEGPLDEEYLVFYTNTPQEELTVPAKASVPVDLAIRAAREFFADPRLPPALRWDEL